MKRLIAGPLWFIAFALMYELLWSLTGVTRLVGPVIGLVVAATVWVDPLHLLWPAPSRHAIAGLPSTTALRASVK